MSSINLNAVEHSEARHLIQDCAFGRQLFELIVSLESLRPTAEGVSKRMRYVDFIMVEKAYHVTASATIHLDSRNKVVRFNVNHVCGLSSHTELIYLIEPSKLGAHQAGEIRYALWFFLSPEQVGSDEVIRTVKTGR